MSSLSQFFNGGIKSVQTGYINGTTLGGGVEDSGSYIDVSISAVNPAKSIVFFVGGVSNTSTAACLYKCVGSGYDLEVREATYRLISPTVLRLYGGYYIAGRWQVAEFA